MKLDRLPPCRHGDFRDRGEPFLKRPQIEASAADENRQPSGARRRGDFGQRQRAPVPDGTTLAGVEEPIEPVRHLPLGSLAGSRGQDVQIAVALHAVGVDDHAA